MTTPPSLYGYQMIVLARSRSPRVDNHEHSGLPPRTAGPATPLNASRNRFKPRPARAPPSLAQPSLEMAVDREPISSLPERDPRRQQDRLLELDRHLEDVRQLQRGEAAGLGPHAVGDRAREAEGLGRPGVQVDRIVVARDRGVAAAEVVAERPVGGHRRVLELVARSGLGVAVAALQIGRPALPDQLVADRRAG